MANKLASNQYGQELILNLYGCSIKKISSRTQIQKFVTTLCDDVIHMKRYGKALIPHFGHDNLLANGYSLVQLIETSCVTGHFSEHKKSVYLNIFSCAWFDPQKTTLFCKKYFEATSVTSKLVKRP